MVHISERTPNVGNKMGKKHSLLVEKLLNFKQEGKILDLGCGNGRNSIFLSEKGFEVTSIDISKENIETIKSVSKNIKAIVADISTYKIEEDYDVIISTAVLHFLNQSVSKSIINQMKEHTKKEGINIISVFTEDNPSKRFPNLFKSGELKSFYRDWNIIRYKEFITPIECHGEKPHRHAIAILVAKKK